MTQAAQAVKTTSGTMTRAAWEQRARELAEARQTSAPRILAADSFRKVYGVKRSSGLGEYVLLYTPFDKRVMCDCVAAQYSRPCCHAGAVLQAEEKRLARIEAADSDRWALVEAGQW